MTETKADLKSAVLSQLGKGKSQALHGKRLAQRLGEKDTRMIRLAIQQLIVEEHPIIGSAKYGYFIAETANECRENLDQLSSTLKMVGRHRKYLQKASFKHFSGQMRLV